MKITADTTDEQILEGVDFARQMLATGATEGKDSEALAGLVNSVAEAEGRAYARARYRDMVRGEASPEAIERSLFNLLATPLDDEWSGRKNDVRRARFVAMQREVNDLVWKVRR